MKNHVWAILAVPTLAFAVPSFATDEVSGIINAMTAVPLDRAVDEFGKVCLSAYPDKKRLAYVLEKSDFAYQASADSREWRSKYATVADVDMPGDPNQCAFDAILPADDMAQDAVVDAIEKKIVSELSVRPTRLVYPKGMKWEWQEGPRTNSVTYYFGAPIKDRQLVLTYRVGPKG
jgi:hypothetical protein